MARLVEIIETKRGKQTVVFRSNLSRCLDRLKQLRSSGVPNATYKINHEAVSPDAVPYRKLHKHRSH